MNKSRRNPNSIDPTEYPLEKVPQVVGGREDDDELAGVEEEPPRFPEDSPVEAGIVEEQQGDLEGLDGENSELERSGGEGDIDDSAEIDDVDIEADGSRNA